VHYSCQEREKKEKAQTINHQRQSNNYLSTCATLYEKEHDCASSETADG
jgi:hypothetical protein